MSAASDPEGPLTSSIERLRHELDRWLDAARSNSEKALEAVGIFAGKGFAPSVDVLETAEEVLVYVDLPGVPARKVDLSLVGNMLSLKGEKPDLASRIDCVSQTRERATGEFERAIPLPAPVDTESVHAETTDGVLVIRLQKSERSKARQIPIGQSRPAEQEQQSTGAEQPGARSEPSETGSL